MCCGVTGGVGREKGERGRGRGGCACTGEWFTLGVVPIWSNLV